MHPDESDVEVLAWYKANPEDLWIFDKLILAKRLGYTCGPVGTIVPKPGEYIVRPCVNVPGMGRGAKITYIEYDTLDHPDCHPGFFWCEVFYGRHISVDYYDGVQTLTVEGTRDHGAPPWRFIKWQKVDDILPLPEILLPLKSKYKCINIEYIDGKPIEVHLRHNPDFVHGNSIAIPVWQDQIDPGNYPGLKYIEAQDYYRKGFWID